jgi:histidine ammonia-lyase
MLGLLTDEIEEGAMRDPDRPAVSCLAELFEAAGWDRTLTLSAEERAAMERGVEALSATVAAGERVYGLTQGFGPLVGFEANATSNATSQLHGMGLISHLGTGQGPPLSPEITRLMLWIRLQGMKSGHSAVSPDSWTQLADLWNRGFTPIIPREGSLSASGDLAPLAHAALAFSGTGEAWAGSSSEGWTTRPASAVLSELSGRPFAWGAREALAFVNGTTASLAVICHNHAALSAMARGLAALTGRIVTLLGASGEAYADELGAIRRDEGHRRAAGWIRGELDGYERDPGRPLQEPYSLRCAPQIIGAILEELAREEQALVREATASSDNPVIYDGRVLHGGNFHALALALCSDQQALCGHQLAFLAERQLNLLLDPTTNGGKPPMLTPRPGTASGLAGVQLSATSFVARIRQLAYPATLTALPTNLGNQDHVPMALNGANATAELIELGWLVIGSLALAVNQWTYLDAGRHAPSGIWTDLQEGFTPVVEDRPLAPDVRSRAGRMKAILGDSLTPVAMTLTSPIEVAPDYRGSEEGS